MPESGFIIDGTAYDVPTLDTFSMDEAEILYKCSGLTLEDFAVDEEDPEASEQLIKNIRNPGFIRALMTVAYIRGNPGISQARASSVIGKANLLDAIKEFAEADADPPELTRTTNEPDEPVASSESSSDPSGGTSIEGLAAREDPRVITGTSA